MPQQIIDTLILSMGRCFETCLAFSGEIISPTKDRMFLAGLPSQGCFGLQSHCALATFFSIKLLFIPLISLLQKYPGETAPNAATITLLVQRFRDTGSVADRKRSGRASIVKTKVADVETALQRSQLKRRSV
ncbi:DUF4817 domain-containing protein [Trichonephila clavipes]|nr:DUF4817 domain-containing protein [Trichonephila clavipes]